MDYVILLDDYQGQQGPDNYAVSYEGTLDDCRAQTNHDGNTWPKSHGAFDEISSEPKTLIGPTAPDAGRIVGLEPRAADDQADLIDKPKLKKTATKRKPRKKPAKRPRATKGKTI